MTRLVIENRTGEPVTLEHLDRRTMRSGRLYLAPGAAGTINGEPSDIAWTNGDEVPFPMLPASVVDDFAARNPGETFSWKGLTCRVERDPEEIAA